MSDDLTARDVIAQHQLVGRDCTCGHSHRRALLDGGDIDDIAVEHQVAALAAAGYTIVTVHDGPDDFIAALDATDDWEWGYQKPWRGSTFENPTGRGEAEEMVAIANERGWEGWHVVRRTPERPAGPWEVVPDAR